MESSGAGKSSTGAIISYVVGLISQVSNNSRLIAWSQGARRQRVAVVLKAQRMKEEAGGGNTARMRGCPGSELRVLKGAK